MIDIKQCKECGAEITDDTRRVYCSMKCMEKAYSKNGMIKIFHQYAEEQIRNQIWYNMSDKEQEDELMKYAKDFLEGKI